MPPRLLHLLRARLPHLHRALVVAPGFREIAPLPPGHKFLQLHDPRDRLPQLDGQCGRIHGGGLIADSDQHLATDFQDLHVGHLGHSLSNALERAYLARGLLCREDLVCHHERGLDLVVFQATRLSQAVVKTDWKPMNTSAVATLQVTNVNILNTMVMQFE